MSGFRWTLAALVSHWRRRPVQLAALLAGLALATALWSGVQGLNAQARESYDRAAAMLGDGGLTTLARPEGGTVDQALWVRLRRLGWPVSPVVEGRALIGGRGVQIMGIEPVSFAGLGAAAPAAGGAALFGADARTLAAGDTLAELGLAEGDAPTTAAGALPPLARADGVAAGTLLVDIGAAQAALGLEGRVTRLLAPAGFAPDPESLAAASDGRLAVAEDASAGDLDRLTASFHMNLAAFGLLAFAVGLFIAHAAAGLAFEQRLATVRTLRACGVSRGALAAALLAELGALALVAGAAGVALGYLVAAALLPDVAATLRGLYGAPVSGSFAVSPSWWLSGLGMAGAGALAAAGAGLWRAVSMPPLAPARPLAWLDAHERRMRAQGAAGAGLLMLAAMIARAGETLEAGFAMMGALLLGAALLLPVALGAALRLAGLRWAGLRAREPLLGWAMADARAGLSALSLALMALMLALSANIGVGAMVGSFRTTFDGWLDQRLAADYYLRAPEAAVPALEAAAAEAGATLLPTRSAETRVGGWPVEAQGLVPAPLYRETWPLIARLPDAWDQVAAGEAALVSEQLARRLRVAPGDAVTAGGAWTLTVAGVYPDYGNPKGQLIVAHDAHAARFPEARRGAFHLIADPAAAERLAALPEVDLVDQAQIKAFSKAIFERTFAVTAALNVLTLGVAAVALLTSLAALADMRLPQLAPLWAMGVTRAQLARLEMAKILGLALATALIAIPFGVALAWCLVAVVNVQAFGWRLPLHVFPGEWLRLILLALGAAGLAALWPIRRLARTPPAALAQTLAQDR